MFTDPVKNLKAFGLREDMIVADLGAGSGFYAIPAAKMVPFGKVYAIEIQKDFLATLRRKAADERLSNLECMIGNVEKTGGTNLKDKIADAVIASNVLFQVEDREGFAGEVKRILRPGGRLLLIDWQKDSFVIKQGFNGTVLPDEARRLFEKNGLAWVRDLPVSEHHYGMIFENQRG